MGSEREREQWEEPWLQYRRQQAESVTVYYLEIANSQLLAIFTAHCSLLTAYFLANIFPVPWLVTVGAEAEAFGVAHEPLVNARLNLQGTV